MKIPELSTPCALVDLDLLEANTARMAQRMTRLGVRLRPHVKTHKCIEAAGLQVRGHFGGIAVSTMAEAKFFAAAGYRDINYAVPIAGCRLAEAAEFTPTVDSFSVVLDHERTLQQLEERARLKGVRFSVFLKVDCGYHRSGIDPNGEESVALAAKLNRSQNVDFRGLLTHAGHAYHCRNSDQVLGVARQERDVLVGFAHRLRQAGIAVSEISVGSTPTMSVIDNLEGVTEARPGNYVFYDRFQAAIGNCRLRDVALTVLTTVVGHYPEEKKLLIDAGGLSFSRDPGPTHMDPECGYGAFFSEDKTREYPTLRLINISQELGKVVAGPTFDIETVPIGTRLQVIPNHACLTSALYDRYHICRRDEVVDEWRPVRGW
jgi:D-serine deaminase-like pyridoxal phosphate-dependent protein